MGKITVKNMVFGDGIPKICVPIVGITKEAILNEARAITKLPADVVEWRIDWFENVFDFAALEDVLKDLREVLGDMPILMTFRTSKELGLHVLEVLQGMLDSGKDQTIHRMATTCSRPEPFYTLN